MGTYDAMWRSFYISAIFSTIFVALVQFFPLKVVPWTFLVGCVLSIVVGLVVMMYLFFNIEWQAGISFLEYLCSYWLLDFLLRVA